MFDVEIILRIVIAFILGGAIGLERQWRHRTAGLRTNTLVSVGSALFVILSIKISGDTSPSRIASQIVSGIGFLGAGVIMKEGFTVRGLNTAATLWCSAAVGSLSGMGLWDIALVGTVVVVLAHISLRPIANYMNMRPVKMDYATTTYDIKIICQRSALDIIRIAVTEILNKSKFQMKSLKSTQEGPEETVEVHAEVFIYGKHVFMLENIIRQISEQENVLSVSWEIIDKNDD
ncbi:MAG: putative Mg(2+) transport ATPase [Bacteroidetes bacterium ADurb.Bin408]|nr:MAG: putative Mg(2+) transport ATPase [Bacteroidetes bacterium ADurb.Bin408]